MTPARIFLDTNVYILGVADPDSAEGKILQWAGLETESDPVELIVSDELVDQIRRVGRRLRGKDWAGELLMRLWRNMRLLYVRLEPEMWTAFEAHGFVIPAEDVTVYLTARAGAAQCFVSANHKLIAALAQQTGEFECLTPAEFVQRYLG